jgi:hypothetical protein
MCASNYSTLSSRAVVRSSRKHGFAQNLDDDSVHPLTDPDDPTTGNIDPVVPLGNAPAGTDAEPAEGEDARLMGPSGN